MESQCEVSYGLAGKGMLAGGLSGNRFRESLAVTGWVQILFAIHQHLIHIRLAF